MAKQGPHRREPGRLSWDRQPPSPPAGPAVQEALIPEEDLGCDVSNLLNNRIGGDVSDEDIEMGLVRLDGARREREDSQLFQKPLDETFEVLTVLLLHGDLLSGKPHDHPFDLHQSNQHVFWYSERGLSFRAALMH